jgi:hypothetical protein
MTAGPEKISARLDAAALRKEAAVCDVQQAPGRYISFAFSGRPH